LNHEGDWGVFCPVEVASWNFEDDQILAWKEDTGNPRG